MWRTVRKIRFVLSAAGLCASAFAFAHSPLYEAVRLVASPSEPFLIASYRLKHLKREDYEAHIKSAVAEEDFDTAQQVVRIGSENGIVFDPALIASTEESASAKALRTARDFAQGFITGKADSISGLTGAVSSDFLVVGDLRDIALQGGKAVRGEDHDKLVLGLSLLGVATVMPVTGPVDIAASLLKTAKRTGKLSKGLSKSLTRSAGNLIDGPALKAALYRTPRAGERLVRSTADDAAKTGNRFSRVVRADAAKELQSAVISTAAIAERGGLKAVTRALALADEPADLVKISRLSAKAGDRTSAILKSLGKNAYRLGKLTYLIMAAVISIIGWIFWACSLSIRMSHGVFRKIEKLAFSRS